MNSYFLKVHPCKAGVDGPASELTRVGAYYKLKRKLFDHIRCTFLLFTIYATFHVNCRILKMSHTKDINAWRAVLVDFFIPSFQSMLVVRTKRTNIVR